MEEDLRKQFDDMGLEPSSDFIAKSMDLCITYHTDPMEFVEQWMAFSISNLQNAEPALEHLGEFERKVFLAKRDKELVAANIKKAKYAAALSNRSHVNSPGRLDSSTLGSDTYADDEMLDSYVCHTPKTRRPVARTPARHNDALFSPASYSPMSAGTPRTHNASHVSGKVVCTSGNPAIINAGQWSAQLPPHTVQVRQLLLHNGEPHAAPHSKYMFDILSEKAELLSDRIFRIGKSLCQKVFGPDDDDHELHQVDVHAQHTVKTIGTICCDHDGPLDASSTMLVGTDEMRCRTVRLNFSQAKSVGVFPGQIAIVSGLNPRGDMLLVEEILAERQMIPPKPPLLSQPLSFVIAAGPFTHDDDLVYDPLNDLVTYLKDNKPDVLILVGPFLEADHKLISENITIAETFESFFEKMIAGIVDVIGTTTTVLIVSSHKDANADAVYPTMPLQVKKPYANVHFLPDPSMVDLNGVIVGLTSTDIVEHIIANELAINAGDKIKRVVSHLFNQGSFYPLFPAPEDKLCYDSLLASKYANMEQRPHLLILPSDQKCFIRIVNGCLAINPGRVTDMLGGTFARLVLTPPATKEETNLLNCVGCQIRKI